MLRPDRTGEARKPLRKDFKKYLPARFLDDQRKEIKAYRELLTRASETLWRHVPRYHGTEETDMGVGIVTQLMRDADGTWPKNLQQLLPNGLTPELEEGLQDFTSAVRELRILSRDLLPHNIIAVREKNGSYRVMLVDGIGNAELLPVSTHFAFFATRKTARKISRFQQRCNLLLPAGNKLEV
ncbi:MAG: hypothetical protein Cons2KO_31030 [Congregibacter sp.]